MKILFLHPEDPPERGAWLWQRWDRVVDLGTAGADAYERWAQLFNCPVTNTGLAQLSPGPVRDALAFGLGEARDEHGIDWWEVLSTVFLQPLRESQALRNIASQLAPDDQVVLSRGGFHARALEFFLGRTVTVASRPEGRTARYRRMRRLSPAQLRQVLADKFDGEHRIRSIFATKRAGCARPVVLIPSAYVNVSRAGLAYAQSLPESHFLLAVARRSGWRKKLPENVTQADLAAYFSRRQARQDHDRLARTLTTLVETFSRNPLLRMLGQVPAFDSMEKTLRRWLKVRDAWLNIFDSEPVSAVLCCDGSNPYTLIPLLIAKSRGLPAVQAHHGALDGHYLFKRNQADCFLAKGAMEQDYMIRRCAIEREQVVVAAPAQQPRAQRSEGSRIIFFSEDYEVAGGRVDEFYRSLLPPLGMLAEQNGKELVLKLHPAESRRDRQNIANAVLTRDSRRRLHILEGPLTEELIGSAWVAITGISTTAVDCAIRGVPVFLCEWLDIWQLGYLDQFVRFRVGAKLRDPREILKIPAMLARFNPCDSQMLWAPSRHDELGDVFCAKPKQMAIAI